MTEQRLMKEGLDVPAIERLAGSLARTIPRFPRKRFTRDALDGLQPLELKDRVRHVIRVLHRYLPDDFEETAGVLVQLKENWDAGDPGDNLRGFAAWPVVDYVGEHGLGHPETSLEVLKQLTPLFSAEFAIRPFLVEHPDLTLSRLEAWCTDSAPHVRRLVSEGSRPRLPWGQRLPAFIEDPSPVLRLLERLKDDPSEYVRRSVANHLNDISKDHPERVIALCRQWRKSASAGTRWIVRHATRTIVKAGHPDVFGLLGYTVKPRLELVSLRVAPKRIRLGEAVEFVLVLKSAGRTKQKVVLDYAVHHVKANGKTSPKVFKLRSLEIAPTEIVEVTRRHLIKPVSTRRYYSGEHVVEALINGKGLGRAAFELRID